MLSLAGEIRAHRDLFLILVQRNLKIRYKSSALGFFWSLLGPILLILIYALFARILRFSAGRPNYLQFLVIGIITWQFLSMCLNDSLYAIVGNANLVKKTTFPRIILPLSMVAANLVNFILTCVVLGVYLLISKMPFQHLELLVPVLLTQTALCLGMALILSSLNVFFRDTEHILGVLTLAWFFMTPIIYPLQMQLDAVPAGFLWAAFANPMSGIVWSYRALLMADAMPDVATPGASLIALSFAVSWIILLAGIFVFRRAQHCFGDVL